MPHRHHRSAEPRSPTIVGLIAGPGLPERLAFEVAARAPEVLRERWPGPAWKIAVRTEEFAGAGADVDLAQLARQLMLEEGWDLGVCLTARPLRVGRRPVTAEASASLGVAVISVPALGALGVTRRALDAVLLSIDTMLRSRTRHDLHRDRQSQLQRIDDLANISSSIGEPLEEAPGKIAFAMATAIGHLRLLLGAIRGNRPWTLIVGLSRSLVAALGVSAFALTSPVIWRIANAMRFPRMVVLTLASLAAIGFTFMIAHSLWERTPSNGARARVVLINLATSSTVAIGVATSYIALLLFNTLFASSLIPGSVLETEIKRTAGAVQYLRVAWLVSSLATLGGALGAVVESNAAVRAAAYCMRPVARRTAEPARGPAPPGESHPADP